MGTCKISAGQLGEYEIDTMEQVGNVEFEAMYLCT
jgi:hypothetical protein